MLPVEIKCLKCVHCNFYLTGQMSCSAHPTRIPKKIVFDGPPMICSDKYSYMELTEDAYNQRLHSAAK